MLHIDLVDEVLDELGRHQAFIETAEDAVREVLAIDDQPIRAGALGAARRPGIAVLAGDRVAATAAGTDEQPAEQELASLGVVESVAGAIPSQLDTHDALARLDSRPERVVDDAQMRNLGDLTGLYRIDAGDLLAGLRVLRAAVPLHAPDIEGIVQQPSAAIDLPADGGVAPGPSTRPRNAFLVELSGDSVRRVAVGKGEKDPADDCRLALIDATLAMLALPVARIRSHLGNIQTALLGKITPAPTPRARLPPGPMPSALQAACRALQA